MPQHKPSSTLVLAFLSVSVCLFKERIFPSHCELLKRNICHLFVVSRPETNPASANFSMSNPQPSLPLYARLAATAFGTVFLASGINANIYLSSERLNGRLFFKEDYRLIETFVEFYAFAEVCMAAAIYVAVYSGDRRVLGSLLVAGGALAFMDGTAFNVWDDQLIAITCVWRRANHMPGGSFPVMG